MTTTRHAHAPGRRSPSLRLDPYAIDEQTITLEEWRRYRNADSRTSRRTGSRWRSPGRTL